MTKYLQPKVKGTIKRAKYQEKIKKNYFLLYFRAEVPYPKVRLVFLWCSFSVPLVLLWCSFGAPYQKKLPRQRKIAGGVIFPSYLCLRELVFTNAAQRAYKIFGNSLPWCTGLYTCLRNSHCGIVLPTTYFTNILCHSRNN